MMIATIKGIYSKWWLGCGGDNDTMLPVIMYRVYDLCHNG